MALSFFNLGARWGGLSTPPPHHFIPWKETRIECIGGCVSPKAFWTGADLAPTGTWSPDRPARSDALYWLNYPGPRRKETTMKGWA